MDTFLAVNRRTLFENDERRQAKALGDLHELAKEHVSQFIEQLIAAFGSLREKGGVEEPAEELLNDMESSAQLLGSRAKAQGADAKCLAHHFGDICELITDLRSSRPSPLKSAITRC